MGKKPQSPEVKAGQEAKAKKEERKGKEVTLKIKMVKHNYFNISIDFILL